MKDKGSNEIPKQISKTKPGRNRGNAEEDSSLYLLRTGWGEKKERKEGNKT